MQSMYIIPRQANPDGSYPPLNQWDKKYPVPPTHYVFPDEYYDVFYMDGKRLKGYVTLEVEDEQITNVTWNDEAYEAAVALLPDPAISARESKITELSTACNAAINAGTDVQLSDGTTESFTYSLEDQANISEMFTAVMAGATQYPYHENGGNCRIYSAADIIAIYSTLSGLKTGQITYNNQLKQYVNTLDDVEVINAVTYGQELTGEYLTTYQDILTEAQTQLQNVLSKIVQAASNDEATDA